MLASKFRRAVSGDGWIMGDDGEGKGVFEVLGECRGLTWKVLHGFGFESLCLMVSGMSGDFKDIKMRERMGCDAGGGECGGGS